MSSLTLCLPEFGLCLPVFHVFLYFEYSSPLEFSQYTEVVRVNLINQVWGRAQSWHPGLQTHLLEDDQPQLQLGQQQQVAQWAQEDLPQIRTHQLEDDGLRWELGELEGGRNHFSHWKEMELLCMHETSFLPQMQISWEVDNFHWTYHFLWLLFETSILCKSQFIPPSNSPWIKWTFLFIIILFQDGPCQFTTAERVS